MNKIAINRFSIKRKFSLMEWFFWSMFASYYPLIVVFLRGRGYKNTTIGIILAINACVTVFAQPLWGIVSDRIRSVKRVFIFCLSLAIILLISLNFCNSVLMITIIFACITFFESGLVPLLDGWVIQGIKGEKVNYGQIRLFGSLGFAASVLIVNAIVDEKGIGMMFILFPVLGLVTILFATFLRDQKGEGHVISGGMNIGALLKNKNYIIYLIFAIILFIPFRSAFFFLPNAMDAVGGTQKDYGIAFSIMALSEVPFFLGTNYLLKKFNPKTLLLISSFFFIVRQIVYLTATTPLHFILAQSTQGLTFALFLTGTVYFVDECAPVHLKATAQTLASAVYYGASGIIGSYGGGYIIDYYGLHTLYKIGIVMSLVSVLFFYIMFFIRKNIIK